MAPHSPSDLGQLNYLAYSEAVGGRTHDGRTMLAWEDLGEKVQGGWIAGAASVADHVAEDQAAAARRQEDNR
ncbi:hypothetical protein ACUXZZ_20675 [Streptomyces graminifolii]|uniref:hypothetical protein n=1 Tax=Streptomyces graminifolii TaxID=1266771 RepID=UPI0040598997